MSVSISDMQALRVSNDALDHPARVYQLLAEDGYVFFRGVLDLDAIAMAYGEMLEVLKQVGMVADDATRPIWTGVRVPEFDRYKRELYDSHLWQRFVAQPTVAGFFERVFGEHVTWAELGVYRCAVGSDLRADPVAGRHQDGFYNQGVVFYTTWIPLIEIDRSLGGIAVASGLHNQGFFHDAGNPPTFAIPPDAIPSSAWRRAEVYEPGDVLIFTGSTPHSGLPNESGTIRLSMDLRFAPVSETAPLTGGLTEVSRDAVTVTTDTGEVHTVALAHTTVMFGLTRDFISVDDLVAGEELPLGTRVIVGYQNGVATVVRPPRMVRVRPSSGFAAARTPGS